MSRADSYTNARGETVMSFDIFRRAHPDRIRATITARASAHKKRKRVRRFHAR